MKILNQHLFPPGPLHWSLSGDPCPNFSRNAEGGQPWKTSTLRVHSRGHSRREGGQGQGTGNPQVQLRLAAPAHQPTAQIWHVFHSYTTHGEIILHVMNGWDSLHIKNDHCYLSPFRKPFKKERVKGKPNWEELVDILGCMGQRPQGLYDRSGSEAPTHPQDPNFHCWGLHLRLQKIY